MMGKLDGKITLVTGGSMGIGAADAKLLAAEGARVIVADVADEAGQALADSIGGVFRHLDVADEVQWKQVISDVDSSVGHIDILINNAGIVAFTPVASTELEEWNRVIGINLTGVFLGICSVAGSMKAAGGAAPTARSLCRHQVCWGSGLIILSDSLSQPACDPQTGHQ